MFYCSTVNNQVDFLLSLYLVQAAVLYSQVTDLALSTAAFQEELASDEDDDEADDDEEDASGSSSSSSGNFSRNLSYALTLKSQYSKARKQRMRKWKRVLGVSEEMVLDAKVCVRAYAWKCNMARRTCTCSAQARFHHRLSTYLLILTKHSPEIHS